MRRRDRRPRGRDRGVILLNTVRALLHDVFGTAALPLDAVLFAVPFPFIMWATDEIRRWLKRRRS